jgi:hypothetical protein
MIFYRCIMAVFFLFVTTSAPSSNVYASNYKSFELLNPDECVPLDKKVIASQLPAEWHKYVDYIKICKLKQKKTSTAKVSIISLWAYDYYETTGESTDLKDLPSPLIVDNNNNKIGELPIIYPGFNIGPPDIHYGKWKSGIPSEILIDDVYNKSDNSYYYYKPIKWNDKSGRYELTGVDKIYGIRPGALDPFAQGTVYKEFKRLNPEDCVPLGKEVVIKQLPKVWHKYVEFIELCKLNPKKESEAKVSIISILFDNYNNNKFVAEQYINDNFPLPLIVDTNYRQLGVLPEQLQNDEPGSVDLFFGKYFSGTPSEIRIDVENPAVSGDYYYYPLVWNKKTSSYEMKSQEVINGRRSRN